MNSTHFKNYILVFQLILLSACSPQATPSAAPSSIPSERTSSPAPIIPIDLGGPQMILGSSYLYADGTLLVPVPAGIFTMGAAGPDNPEHLVNLSDFWIYRTKVTNGQYAYCVSTGYCTPPYIPDDRGFSDPLQSNDPVTGVDYNQAAAYCDFVHARLPTEAEWEKTARGPNGNIYPWGNDAPSCDLLNYSTCVGNTTPVNTYPTGQSYYHAFDMEGNALEWVSDWYQSDYYLSAPTVDPRGPAEGRARSVRSSAFNSGADQTPAFTRSFSTPDTHRNNLGFRCVVEGEDPGSYFAPFCEYPATYGTDGIGGATDGPQTEVECPDISIDQNPVCQGPIPKTYVTFHHPPGLFLVQAQFCQQIPYLPNTEKFVCSHPDDLLRICGKCKVTLTSPPQCPDGYTYNDVSKSCITDYGGEGACLPGFTHGNGVVLTEETANPTSVPNTNNQCCAFEPGSVGLTDPGSNLICEPILLSQPPQIVCHPPFPSCPPGTSFDGNECISVQYPLTCKVELATFLSCTTPTPSSGGDDESCPPPAGGCPISGEVWNENTCSCYCPNLSSGCGA